MTIEFMPLFIKHLNKFVRTIIPSSVSYCVTIDGHRSRKGAIWIGNCIKIKAEFVQSPANTSNFLQACDTEINGKYEKCKNSP